MRQLQQNFIGVLHIFTSSLWITVFVVRVGCIIEAQAHPTDSDGAIGLSSLAASHDAVVKASASAGLNLKRKQLGASKRFFSARHLKTDENSSFSSESSAEDVDTCIGKKDGYYPNLSTGCSGYYFCAAGYQISYVCPANTFFNGNKCTEDHKCEGGSSPAANPCQNLANGYYPMKHSPRKYFYCYHKAKVIELSCSEGKYYNRNEKSCMTMATSSQHEEEQQSNMVADESQNCVNRPNGFYTILSSNCTKYYYCVQGEKTQLECQPNYVFNGQLCVARSQFDCPTATGPNR